MTKRPEEEDALLLHLLNDEYEQELEEEFKREIAVREGIKQGKEQTLQLITHRLLKKGCDIDFIIEITGLTADQIRMFQSQQ